MAKANENAPWKEPEPCEYCGEPYIRWSAHLTVCEERRNGCFDDKQCGMCGEPFTDYMRHLREECPRGQL